MVATSGSRTLHQLHHLPGSTFHSGIHLVPQTFRCKQRKVHGLNLILHMSGELNLNFISQGHMAIRSQQAPQIWPWSMNLYVDLIFICSECRSDWCSQIYSEIYVCPYVFMMSPRSIYHLLIHPPTVHPSLRHPSIRPSVQSTCIYPTLSLHIFSPILIESYLCKRIYTYLIYDPVSGPASSILTNYVTCSSHPVWS